MMTRSKKNQGRGYTRGALIKQQERMLKLAERRAHRNWQEMCGFRKEFKGQDTKVSEQNGLENDVWKQSSLEEARKEQEPEEEKIITPGNNSTPKQRKYVENIQEMQSLPSDHQNTGSTSVRNPSKVTPNNEHKLTDRKEYPSMNERKDFNDEV